MVDKDFSKMGIILSACWVLVDVNMAPGSQDPGLNFWMECNIAGWSTVTPTMQPHLAVPGVQHYQG